MTVADGSFINSMYVRSTDGNGQRSYNGVKRTAFRDFLFNPAYLADTKHGKTFHHFTHSALLHIKNKKNISFKPGETVA